MGRHAHWFQALLLQVTGFPPTTFHWSKHITRLQPASGGQKENLAYSVGPMNSTTQCQPLWGLCKGKREEWGVVGNDSGDQSRWFSFSSSSWTLSPSFPKPSLAGFKGVNFNARSLVRCHWQQTQPTSECGLV